MSHSVLMKSKERGEKGHFELKKERKKERKGSEGSEITLQCYRFGAYHPLQ